MHVCGSHEQAIAQVRPARRLPARRSTSSWARAARSASPTRPRSTRRVALARQGVRVATYGDMLRVPGHGRVARRRAGRGRARSTSSTASAQAVELARADRRARSSSSPPASRPRRSPPRRWCSPDPPPNFSVLSAHKYIPPVMEIVAEMPEHAGRGVPRRRPRRRPSPAGASSSPSSSATGCPVVVAGFEPLDILAGLVKLVELIRDGTPQVVNMFPRCVTREGNRTPRSSSGRCSGRSAGAGAASPTSPTATCGCATSGRTSTRGAASTSTSPRSGTTRRRRSRRQCICGDIMAGIASPDRLRAVRQGVRARHARSAPAWCSSEGTCKIWHQYGGHPRPRRRRHERCAALLDERDRAEARRRRRAMRALIEQVFARRPRRRRRRDGIGLAAMDDGAALRVGDRWLVITTDSHVVHPIFFPGGDIGRLAVAGTVNDLAMMGATEPLGAHLRASIIEEGFRARRPRAHPALDRARPAREAGATIVTGDTKVMGRGELDGIVHQHHRRRADRPRGARLRACARATASSSPARSATTAWRSWPRATSSALEGELRSDVAPINGLVRAALAAGGDGVVAMKDPTRGGARERAARDGGEERRRHRARRAGGAGRAPRCARPRELLGIDPLHVANEGKAVIGVRPEAAERGARGAARASARAATRRSSARCIAEHAGAVILDTGFGRRLLAEPEGEPLPRIC